MTAEEFYLKDEFSLLIYSSDNTVCKKTVLRLMEEYAELKLLDAKNNFSSNHFVQGSACVHEWIPIEPHGERCIKCSKIQW